MKRKVKNGFLEGELLCHAAHASVLPLPHRLSQEVKDLRHKSFSLCGVWIYSLHLQNQKAIQICFSLIFTILISLLKLSELNHRVKLDSL